jgi:hypothetical protein
MKKLLFLSILISAVILSCNKETEPEPDVIRAYCSLYHFIPGMGSVIWEVDGVEVPDEQEYAYFISGSIILEAESEEIEFSVKQPGTNEVLVNGLFLLEENTYYNMIVCGPAQEPVLLFSEIETTHPVGGNVKMQILHSIAGQGPIDIYMGDTIPEKRVITALDFLELTEPFEVFDYDVRLKMTATAHSDEFDQDSVLLNSEFNEIISGANYLMVVAPFTHDTSSKLTFWTYELPLD